MSPHTRSKRHEANQGNPCPVCQGTSTGCSVGQDGLILCRKRTGQQPGFRFFGQAKGDNQWAQYRRETDPHFNGQHHGLKPNPPKDWLALASQYTTLMTPLLRRALAQHLSLPLPALEALPLIGWRPQTGNGPPSWTFPEADGSGRVIGINRRFQDGTKKAMAGSKRGLTIPEDWSQGLGPVLVSEGASDALALTHARLCAVGRPSNVSGAAMLAELLQSQPPDRTIVVLGEYDPKPDGTWPGREGCQKVAADLQQALGRSVSWAMPPDGSKDARTWFLTKELGDDAQDWRAAGKRFLDALQPQKAKRPASPGAAIHLRRARTLEPYQPFPVDALPGLVADYVRQGALALGCDPAYLALPLLAALASAIGNTRVVRLKRGWTEPSILWAAIVGDSGTLKSPAFWAAISYLLDVQRRLLDEYQAQMVEYQNRKLEYKKTKDEEDTEPPDEPTLQKVIVSDITIERLAEILEDNPRGILSARDELAAWFGSFTRYKGKQGGSDLPNWLEAHRAGTIIYDRKTGDRRSVFVRRAAVSVTGTIQPGVLARVLTAEHLEAGLGARVLMAMPPRLPKKWTEAEIAPTAEKAYHDLLDKLLALRFDIRNGEKVPHVVHLSDAGKKAWVRFYDAWAQDQAAADGEVAAALSKLEGAVARLALIHHTVTRVAAGEDELKMIGEDSVNAGITLCRWFAAEAQRIYATLTETKQERDLRRLTEWIQSQGGRVTAKQLQKSNSRRYPDATAAEAALIVLVEAGLGRLEDRPLGSKGGRPTRDFVLLPTPDDTDETPAPESTPDVETPDQPSDETHTTNGKPRHFPGEEEVSSVSSVVGNKFGQGYGGDRSGSEHAGVSSDGQEVSSDAPGEDSGVI